MPTERMALSADEGHTAHHQLLDRALPGLESRRTRWLCRSVGRPRNRRPLVEMNEGRILPGLGLLLAIGVLARVIALFVPVGSVLIPAILLGAMFANVYRIPRWAEGGVALHKLLLEVGIVLMGVRVTFDALFQTGPRIILIIITILPLTVLVTEFLARFVFELDDKVGSLLAAGTGICGVSAVVAVAGCINAEKEYITYAIATVLFFDVLTLIAFPILGRLLALPDVVFGVWVGVSMLSTGPVTAAGFTYSDVAGQWATITKLARNIFISAAVVFYSLVYTRSDGSGHWPNQLGVLWRNFPNFILGFVGIMLLANAGILSTNQITSIENAYRWLFLFAFAGLGLEMNVRKLRETGLKPLLLVFISLAASSMISLTLIRVLL